MRRSSEHIHKDTGNNIKFLARKNRNKRVTKPGEDSIAWLFMPNFDRTLTDTETIQQKDLCKLLTAIKPIKQLLTIGKFICTYYTKI